MERGLLVRAAGLALPGLGAGAAASARAQPSGGGERCWRPEALKAWKASPDGWSLYLRLDSGRLFRLDLADQCPALNLAGAHLDLKVRSSSGFCRAGDFDLGVSRGAAERQACVINEVTELSPAEVENLPRNRRP